jgi:hypothetical protein
MTDLDGSTLSAADLALAKSTLFKNTLNIPMPPGAVAPREADWVLRQGLEALRSASRPENQGTPNAARQQALQHFGQARDRYSQMGDRKGKALANFCRAYVQLLDENLEQARFDCQSAIDQLLDADAAHSPAPK